MSSTFALAMRLSVPSAITNCTIAANHSPASGGGGLFLVSAATIANTIFWANTAASGTIESQQIIGFDGDDSLNYSCVQGLTGSFGGAGNIGLDPLLIGAVPMSTRLSAGSPCIDAAHNSLVPLGIATDLFGNPRFVDDPATVDTGVGTPPIVDMGAAEFGPCQADLNGNREVDLGDLAQLLTQFGTSGPGLLADLDADGDVDLADLSIMLSAFGSICP